MAGDLMHLSCKSCPLSGHHVTKYLPKQMQVDWRLLQKQYNSHTTWTDNGGMQFWSQLQKFSSLSFNHIIFLKSVIEMKGMGQ